MTAQKDLGIDYFAIDIDKGLLREKLHNAFIEVDHMIGYYNLQSILEDVEEYYPEHQDVLTEHTLRARREVLYPGVNRNFKMEHYGGPYHIRTQIDDDFIDNFWRFENFAKVITKVISYITENTSDSDQYWEKYMDFFKSDHHCMICDSPRGRLFSIDHHNNNILPSNYDCICEHCTDTYWKGDALLRNTAITKSFKFASAHFLPKHQGDCQHWHGHEWKLEVTISSFVNPRTGMVMDFSALKTIVNMLVVDRLDHNVLNDYLVDPTAENLLVWIWEQLMFEGQLKGIEKLTLWESDNSYATITKHDMLAACFSFDVE